MATIDSKLQITPCAPPTEYNELNFKGLYLFQILSGPSRNQVFSVSIGELGSIVVFNWVVRDGPNPDAKIIARAQGTHVQGGHWHNSFSLVFENERFHGSTLQVMGIPDPPIPGEWAIVGGTGEFAMATGVIKKREHELRGDYRVVEITIHGFCPMLKNMQKVPVTKSGLFGGNEGAERNINEVPRRLESVTIRSGHAIDSIAFSYIDQYGQSRIEGPWGGSGGTDHKIDLGSYEFAKELSGTYDWFDGVVCLTSFELVTNERTFGPWGIAKGTPFRITAPAGNAIVGFFGRSGKYLNAIGAHLKTL